MDSGKTDNERELTSTMGNVLSVSIKDEKNDTSGSDATPTSSTDANTTTSSSQIVSDDPISSTSSDVVDLNKSKDLETVTQSSVEVTQTGMEEPDKTSSVDPETDLLEMSISSVSRERITEDVEDLVHDLESLLGESTDSFNIPIKRREEQKSPVEKEPTKISQKPNESGDIFSLENSVLEKGIEIVENCDKGKEINKDVINFSLTEDQVETAESSSKQETESCNVGAGEDDKVNKENISSLGDKELPVHTTLESETSLECENVIANPQENQPDTVANENETTEESNVIGGSKLEITECISSAANDKESDVNADNGIEKIGDGNEAEAEAEVHAGSEAAAHTESETETHAETETEVHAGSEAEVHAETEVEVHAGSEAEAHAESEAEAHVESEGEAHAESEAEAHVESEAEVHAESEAAVNVESETEVNAVSEAEVHSGPEEEVHAVPEAEVHAESEAEIHKESEAEVHGGSDSEVNAESEEVNAVSEEVNARSEEVDAGSEAEVRAEPEVEACAESIEKEASMTEVKDAADNKSNDQLKGNEEAEVLSVATEAEPPTVTPDASLGDGNIGRDELEKTEEANTVCETESISRDPKTEPDESVFNEHKETESSRHKELDEHVADKVPTADSISTEIIQDDTNDNLETKNVNSDSPQEIKEIEATATEISREPNNLEKKLEETVVIQSDSESPKLDEIDILEQNSTENVQEISPQINAPVELEHAPDNTDSTTTVCEENSSKLAPAELESSADKSVEKIESPEMEESSNVDDSKSQTNIPESSETEETPEDSIEYARNVEVEEIINTDAEQSSPVQILDESNSNLKELPSESEVPKSLIDDLTIITEEISTVEPNETDPVLESNEEVPQIEPTTEDIQNDDTKTPPPEIEDVTEQTTILEMSELVNDEVSPTPNDSSTDVENQQGPSGEELKENFVEQTDLLLSSGTAPNDEELVQITELTETIDEKREERELQSEIASEKISSDEGEEGKTDPNQASDISKLTDVDEVPSLQQETPLESEAVVAEDVSVNQEGEVQIKDTDELPSATVEIVEGTIELEETVGSAGDISELPTETSKGTDAELNSEVTTPTLVDEDNSKPHDPQLEEDPVSILEELPTEEDKQEQDFEWIEDVAPEEHEVASSTEVIQDDETEDTSNKIIEILDDDDDDSKIIQAENVTFFSPTADSDSEDTVPTLVLEPDEVNPSPELLHMEKETDLIEESTLVVHSTNEIPDKLPEIEDILNDQGNVDDVVENIDMQENLETILAVASLQGTETIESVEVPSEHQISDKERREMEALRMAVESITETAPVEFEQVEDMTELVENIENPPLQQIPPAVKVVDVVEGSNLEIEPQIESIEETKIIEEEKPVQSSTVMNAEVSINETEVEDIKIDENHLIPTSAEETVQTLPDTSEDKVDAGRQVQESTVVFPDSSQSVSLGDEIKSTETFKEKEAKVKANERPKRHKKSSADNKLEELSINVDVPEREKPYSPKVTIKPIKVPDEEVSTTSISDSEIGKGSLKITITKQSDKMHSVLKICESDNSEPPQDQDEPIPKLIIKPKMQQVEQQHSPKMSTRSSKQMYSPTSSTQRSGSPRITIKPVIKPEKESVTPLKIKIKPEEGSKKHSPKLNIKPVTKPEEECRENIQSPRKVTIKPVLKSPEEMEQVQSPRITIKPIPKPEPEKESVSVTPRLNIKPIKKQDEDDLEIERERSSPKITIKPLVKPQEPDTQATETDDSVKERIVLKINKGNLPTPTKESKKREHPPDDEKSEKLAKITVKFSKGGGHPHIVQQSEESNKRIHEEQPSPEKVKKQKTENESPVLTRSKHKDVSVEHFPGDTPKTKQREPELHIVETRSKHTHSTSEAPIEAKRAKLRETPEASHAKQRESINELLKSRTNNEHSDDVKIIETKLDSPIVISEDSRSQDSGSCIIVEDAKDPLGNIPVYEVSMKTTPETPPVAPVKQDSASSTPTIPITPTPRKRGRPRKVPIVVREEFKEQEEPAKPEPKKEEPPLVHESGRPKRSCRGQSVRATLGIKPRKPRGPGRGRGSKRGMGTRVVPMKPEEEPKLSKAKLKLIQDSLKVELLRADEIVGRDTKTSEPPQVLDEDIKPPAPVLAQREQLASEVPSILVQEPPIQEPLAYPASLPGASPKPVSSLLTTEIADSTSVPPATPSTSGVESSEIVMVDEETRMSADTNSRAQTPAKQVVPSDAVIEESQSSVQSTATTESGKAASSRPNKAPRLEVQEPEGAVISADQLTEYYWNGNGPFMLQEQVAQFLGIKSFKRKYPGIMRRMLEMQERDFIRESGLASEHMCDLGLTAVNSADILDIMYSDFQEKYEEYCKHQRDRQAKELINKQKALSLAASQEKNKADITEQAVQSAAQWNASFNKARKEQRKACMDLQTLTVHYPKGKMKQINKPKVGNYPVALVPGQFTDYYKEFTPTEINNLPLNTLCYNEINIIPPEESEDSASEGSDSDSDSSSSSSDSCSSSSGVEDCKLCKHTPKKGLSSK